MIGIGGDPAALAEFGSLYRRMTMELREAVLEAYLIADDPESVYELASNAAVGGVRRRGGHSRRDGCAGALVRLRDRADMSEEWIDAVAVSGDADLFARSHWMAATRSARRRRSRRSASSAAVTWMRSLVEIYRAATTDDIREAALDGMLIAGYDEGVLELYRASQEPAEKKELLEFLIMMDSDAVWDIVDSALEMPE